MTVRLPLIQQLLRMKLVKLPFLNPWFWIRLFYAMTFIALGCGKNAFAQQAFVGGKAFEQEMKSVFYEKTCQKYQAVSGDKDCQSLSYTVYYRDNGRKCLFFMQEKENWLEPFSFCDNFDTYQGVLDVERMYKSSSPEFEVLTPEEDSDSRYLFRFGVKSKNIYIWYLIRSDTYRDFSIVSEDVLGEIDQGNIRALGIGSHLFQEWVFYEQVNNIEIYKEKSELEAIGDMLAYARDAIGQAGAWTLYLIGHGDSVDGQDRNVEITNRRVCHLAGKLREEVKDRELSNWYEGVTKELWSLGNALMAGPPLSSRTGELYNRRLHIILTTNRSWVDQEYRGRLGMSTEDYSPTCN